MNILRKTATTFLLFSAVLLTGCNGLKNEKEVTVKDFVTAAAATVGTNTYNVAVSKGTQTSISNKKETKVDVNVTYKWTSGTQTWTPDTTADALDHVTTDVASIAAAFTVLGIKEPDLHYYVADNGFRIKGNGTTTLLGANLDMEVEAIYNEFGYPTKHYTKAVSSMVVQGETVTATETSNISISYKTEN